MTPISSSGRPPIPFAHSARRPRSIKLALFDLDGTLTREGSAWEYLHRRLGVWEGHAEKYQQAFLRGEIDYFRFCELDAAVWKGMRVSALEAMLREVPLYEGIEDLISYLKGQNIRLGIISSGLSLLAEWIKDRYGFDFSVANELGVTDGILDGTIRIHVHYDQKGKWVKKAKRLFRANKEEVLAFGDSSGDIVMFQQAGMSIAFNSRSSLLNEAATLSIHSSDLRDLIPPLISYLNSRQENFQPRNGG
ncbi:MAG: phosphoserine phosphatase-like hydrolase [Deltaproteobacteria bacterium]|nr:phosphoserine phosphatase-like hydrolase [Deltaproteobacteria bacterium]